MDFFPLFNSLRIAVIATIIIFFMGIFAAYYIAKLPNIIKGVLDVILTLPLVLPPTVVGYLLLTKVFNPIREFYYCLVDYVCVASDYRGLGVSDKMINYAESTAKSMDCKYMQLTCSTFRTSAHKLYQRCGFVKRDSFIYRKELV